MASKVQICNMALVQLGQATITALTDNTANAKRCNELYDLVRKIVLEAHPWNGCVKMVALSQVVETPVYKWTYVHQLPTNCIRVLETDQDVNNKREWEQMGNKIYSDFGDLNIKYIYDNEDTTLFSPALVVALSARLEAELAYPCTGSTTLAQAKLEIYENIKLPEAKALDAQVGRPVEADDEGDSFLTSRA